MDLDGALVDLLGRLSALPPDTNRFTATADYLKARIAYQLDTRPRPLTFVFAGLLIIVLILAVIGLVFRLRTKTFRLFTVNSGLIMPQATMLFALGMSVFSIAEVAALVLFQVCADQGKPLPVALIFLMGTIWIPAYLAVGPWLWSIAAASIRAKVHAQSPPSSSFIPAEIRKAGSKDNYRRAVILLNCSAISSPILGFPPLIVVFYLAAKSWSDALPIFLGVIKSLEAAAPTYDPSTFAASDIIILLLPIVDATKHVRRLLHFYQIGFAVWVGYNAIFLTWLTPFFYLHMKQLITLSKRTPSSRLSVSASTGSTTISLFANRSKNSGSHAATVASRQTEYKIVCLTSATVYLVGLIITGDALAVCLNPAFIADPVKGAIFLYIASGAFAVFSPFVMVVFTWRSYVAYRDLQRSKHHGPGINGSNSIGHQRFPNFSAHQVRFDRFEESKVEGVNGISDYPLPLTSHGVGEVSMADEACSPESRIELGEVKETQEDVSLVKVTVGWSESARLEAEERQSTPDSI